MNKMKIDFRKIELTKIDGTTGKADIAKDLANVLYYQTSSIAAVSTALDIYKTGQADLDKETAAAIKAVVSRHFTAVVQIALNPLLDAVING